MPSGSRARRARRAIILAALASAVPLAAPADDLARGDAAWAERARGERDGRPAPDAIRESILAYERALAARPDDLSARWKLLRSLHFDGAFVSDDPGEQRRIFERATEVSEDGLARLAERAGDGERLDELPLDSVAGRLEAAALTPDDVARLHFWTALAWGSWSRTVGLLAAVRQGVANRIRRATELSIALEPGYEEGGGYRLLGRLHATLPRVPFLSGWVDREKAIPLVERARAIAPEHPGNRLLLAMTLLDLAPERRDEAVALLEAVASTEPRPEALIEEGTMRTDAADLLAEVRAAGA